MTELDVVSTGTGGGWVSARCPRCGRLVGDTMKARPGWSGRLRLALTHHQLTVHERCQWFALCDHLATGTMAHPVLGEVPICDRCRANVAAIEAATRD